MLDEIHNLATRYIAARHTFHNDIKKKNQIHLHLKKSLSLNKPKELGFKHNIQKDNFIFFNVTLLSVILI